MKLIGVETSCDESAVSILECEGSFPDFRATILGNALASQAQMHAQYGGVFPAMAKREHAKNLTPLLEMALKESGLAAPSGHNSAIPSEEIAHIEKMLEREPELFAYLSLFLSQYKIPDIDAIAVTVGPGLEPCLWVGINFARALSYVWKKPIIATNHMEGHIIASLMRSKEQIANIKYQIEMQAFQFPALALLISGGHTELILMKDFMQYEYLGRTRDDAVGEAFDKVARMMNLPYPGGPQISKLAEAARTENLKAAYQLPRPMLGEDNYDFSFSGLKTAASKIVSPDMNEEDKKKCAREFEDCVADVLTGKTARAVEHYGVNTVIVGGGVSANTFLRSEFERRLSNTKVLLSAPELATDNAIMIALAGYFHGLKKEFVAAENMAANGALKLA